MKHLKLFEQFSNFLNETRANSMDGKTDSPEWFNKYEMTYLRNNSPRNGFGQIENEVSGNNKSYFCNSDGLGVKESVDAFFKTGKGLCNEAHLFNQMGEESVITKSGNSFTIEGPEGENSARSIEEAISYC
jgi:hypothetical protein